MSQDTESGLFAAASNALASGSDVVTVDLSALYELLGEWSSYREYLLDDGVADAAQEYLNKGPTT